MHHPNFPRIARRQWTERIAPIKKPLTKVLKAILDGIYPHRCLVCDRFFLHSFNQPVQGDAGEPGIPLTMDSAHHLFSSYACPLCLAGFKPIQRPTCSICGMPFGQPKGEDHPCSTCIQSPPYYSMARSFIRYESLIRKMIHRTKFNHDLVLGKQLGRWLFYQAFKENIFSKIDMIVPVPLHISRLRQRGFNQSYILIREWRKLFAQVNDLKPEFQIRCDGLKRDRATLFQAGLDRKKRMRNVKNAFSVPLPSVVEGQNILLVDDVWTTGATLNECAGTLLRSNAKAVFALTLARVV